LRGLALTSVYSLWRDCGLDETLSKLAHACQPGILRSNTSDYFPGVPLGSARQPYVAHLPSPTFHVSLCLDA